MEKVVFIANLEEYLSDNYDLDDDDDFVIGDSYLPLHVVQHIDENIIGGEVFKKQEDVWLIDFLDDEGHGIGYWFPRECFVLEIPTELTGTEL